MWEQLLSSPGSLPQGLSQQECEKQMEKLADQVRVGYMAGFGGGPRDTLLMATRNPSKNSPVEGKVVEIPISFTGFFKNTSRVVQDF